MMIKGWPSGSADPPSPQRRERPVRAAVALELARASWRSAEAKRHRAADAALDEGLEETFPASDPVAVSGFDHS